MTRLHELAERCDAIAKANGFDPPTWENFVEKMAFAATELDEARDGVVGLAKDPLAEELADTAIRLLSVLHGVWGRQWADRVTHGTLTPVTRFRPIEVLLWPTLGHILKAIECHRHEGKVDACQHIELAIQQLFGLADSLGVKLDNEIEAKCERNRSRGHLHGKVRSKG